MTNSWNPKRDKKQYDRTGSIVLNRVRLGQAPVPLHRIRWKRRGLWLFLVLALIGGGLALWLTFDARFYVYDAQITGNRRLSQAEIFEASGLQGLHILWARSGSIESRILEDLPSLENAEADCHLPLVRRSSDAKCAISVVERRPRVLWYEGSGASGEQWWIDEQGAVFLAEDDVAPLATDSGSEGVSDPSGRWTVTGPLPRDGQGRLDEQVRVALKELWESGRDLPTEFQYTPDRGFSFVDEHGWHIFVGQDTGMAQRLRVLDNLAAHLESRGVTPRFVDVRYLEAPFYAPAAN